MIPFYALKHLKPDLVHTISYIFSKRLYVVGQYGIKGFSESLNPLYSLSWFMNVYMRSCKRDLNMSVNWIFMSPCVQK